jgi:hypothetical protein
MVGPRPRCARCGSIDTIRIVYGLPSFETAEAEDRGELAIGGCLSSEESPDRRCKACGWEFNVLTENVT